MTPVDQQNQHEVAVNTVTSTTNFFLPAGSILIISEPPPPLLPPPDQQPTVPVEGYYYEPPPPLLLPPEQPTVPVEEYYYESPPPLLLPPEQPTVPVEGYYYEPPPPLLLPPAQPVEIDYFDSLQSGIRFEPTDVELIRDYLKPKIAKSKNQLKSRIHCVNVYDYSPDELTAKHRPFLDKDWYFFTPRDRKYPNGSRPDRAAGNGFWKASSKDKQIVDNGVKIGTKKTLVFHIKKSADLKKAEKTNWMMYEYRDETEIIKLPKDSKNKKISMLDDNILCKIYKNNRGKAEATEEVVHPSSTDDHHLHQQKGKRKLDEFEMASPVNETGDHLQATEVVHPLTTVHDQENRKCEVNEFGNNAYEFMHSQYKTSAGLEFQYDNPELDAKFNSLSPNTSEQLLVSLGHRQFNEAGTSGRQQECDSSFTFPQYLQQEYPYDHIRLSDYPLTTIHDEENRKCLGFEFDNPELDAKFNDVSSNDWEEELKVLLGHCPVNEVGTSQQQEYDSSLTFSQYLQHQEYSDDHIQPSSGEV